MDKENINRLLNIDPSSFDFSKMKLAIETRDEFFKAIDKLSNNGGNADQINSLVAKANLFESEIDTRKKEELERARAADNGSSASYSLRGGKPLNESGSIRLYSPNQRISNDFDKPQGTGRDVDLGSYLRAVVDKPRNSAEREIVQNSVTSGDYELPTHIAGELIDRLRAVNPLLRNKGAGARTVTLDGGDTKFIKINSDPNAIWHSELTSETPSDPSFGSVTMSPKTVLSMTEVGRELLQDSANVEEALASAFVGSLNDAILTATFTGSGANTPTGLATTVTQTDTYTNGGSPDWTNFVGASKTLHDQNVPNDNRSFIHAPDVWETLALTKDNNGRYQDAPSFIRDVPNFTSSGLTAGQAYAGDFSNVVYGFRLNITLEQFPAALAKSYGTLWVAAARLDIATFRPNALVRVEEAAA